MRYPIPLAVAVLACVAGAAIAESPISPMLEPRTATLFDGATTIGRSTMVGIAENAKPLILTIGVAAGTAGVVAGTACAALAIEVNEGRPSPDGDLSKPPVVTVALSIGPNDIPPFGERAWSLAPPPAFLYADLKSIEACSVSATLTGYFPSAPQ